MWRKMGGKISQINNLIWERTTLSAENRVFPIPNSATVIPDALVSMGRFVM